MLFINPQCAHEIAYIGCTLACVTNVLNCAQCYKCGNLEFN